jgi:hypothetical protein
VPRALRSGAITRSSILGRPSPALIRLAVRPLALHVCVCCACALFLTAHLRCVRAMRLRVQRKHNHCAMENER